MFFQKEINHIRFIFTVIAAFTVSILPITISKYDIETSLAVGLGSFISTLVAFRWAWSTRFSWEYYLISIRPLFQTVSYIFVILGPMYALSGMYRYMSFPGAIDYYWYLYLIAPLAFIFYEFGYEYSLRKMTHALHPISVQTLAINSNIVTFALYIFIVLFFTYFCEKIGIDAAGIAGTNQAEGYILYSLSYLYDGFFSACLFLITIKWSNNDSKINIIYLLMGLTLFGILILSNSRTRAITIGMMCLSAFQIYNNKFIKNIKYILIIFILFLSVTIIRKSTTNYFNKGVSVSDKLKIGGKSLTDKAAGGIMEESIRTDISYRINGIEWAGAMIHSYYTLGTPFLWGENFFWGAYQAVPEVLLPFPKKSPPEISNLNFKLPKTDPNGSIFASAVADAGPLGIIIGYFVIGFFNGALWCYAASPKTSQCSKLAYLALIPTLSISNNLGSYIFMNIRYGIIFSIIFWIIITVGKLFLPSARYEKKRILINKYLLETNRKSKRPVQNEK